MGQEELMNQIAELEREIALLPEGSITKKKIKDKEYFYCNSGGTPHKHCMDILIAKK